MARQAAIESQLARYIPIECGHFTTLDALDVYLVLRPKRGMAYCETCHEWLKIAKPPAPKTLPETPLFLWLPQSNALGVPHREPQQRL